MELRPDDRIEIGERFRGLRGKAFMTQSRLAGILNVCRQSISEIENGRVFLRCATWERFRDLESKHNQPPIRLPVRWF